MSEAISGEVAVTGGPGTWACAPKDVPHTLANCGADEGRVLCLCSSRVRATVRANPRQGTWRCTPGRAIGGRARYSTHRAATRLPDRAIPTGCAPSSAVMFHELLDRVDRLIRGSDCRS
jgi:hypothetical protein